MGHVAHSLLAWLGPCYLHIIYVYVAVHYYAVQCCASGVLAHRKTSKYHRNNTQHHHCDNMCHYTHSRLAHTHATTYATLEYHNREREGEREGGRERRGGTGEPILHSILS